MKKLAIILIVALAAGCGSEATGPPGPAVIPWDAAVYRIEYELHHPDCHDNVATVAVGVALPQPTDTLVFQVDGFNRGPFGPFDNQYYCQYSFQYWSFIRHEDDSVTGRWNWFQHSTGRLPTNLQWDNGYLVPTPIQMPGLVRVVLLEMKQQLEQ